MNPTIKKIFKKIGETFKDDEGKVSIKRTSFPIALGITVLLTYMQGTGHFENDISSIINNFIFCSFGLVASSLAEKFARKR